MKGYQRVLGGILAAIPACCWGQTHPTPTTPPTPAPGERIALKPEMIFNETAIGNPGLLVDEQSAIGDPASGKGNRPERPYFPGWAAWSYPVHLLIDLGARYRLSQVYLYNETGKSPLILSTGSPANWQNQNVLLDRWREWQGFPVNTATRYLRLTLTQPVSLPEIALYGERLEQPVPPSRPSLPKRRVTQATMDQFIGTNAFIDDPVETLAAPVGFVREYHTWAWDVEGPDHQFRLQPSGAAGGHSWFFDDYYHRLKALGVTVSPAIQQTSPAAFPNTDAESKPISSGADPEDPASYLIHAKHLFQYAARYGHNTGIPDSALQLAPDQPRRAGLNSLRYIENWNEPNKTWRNKEGYFSPYALAAMCSADRDGDQGRLGKNVGIRGADPTMKLVMGGLVGVPLDYLKAMKFWADTHRGGDFPADVLNVHIYISDGDDNQAFKTMGICPEEGHLREKLAALVAWRNANLPDRELWVTEFGYDTNPGSPLHAPALGAASAEEIQGRWLARSFLELAAAGVDRAAMFMFRDVASTDPGVFATSGLVTQKGEWKPKPSYYYLATLKRRLAGMRFAGDIPSGAPDVRIYRFAGSGGKTAYALWCPTSQDKHVSGVTLPLPAATKTATRIDMAVGDLAGQATPLPVQQNKVTVDISERPILVIPN